MGMADIVYFGCRISTLGSIAAAQTDPFWGWRSTGGFGYQQGAF